jgi:hypothetical protein
VLQDWIAGNSLEQHPKLCGHISESKHDIFCGVRRGRVEGEVRGRERTRERRSDRGQHLGRESRQSLAQESIHEWSSRGNRLSRGGKESDGSVNHEMRCCQLEKETHREEINSQGGDDREPEEDSVEEHGHLKIREVPDVG